MGRASVSAVGGAAHGAFNYARPYIWLTVTATGADFHDGQPVPAGARPDGKRPNGHAKNACDLFPRQ
jgi:hypothetical protein